MLYYNNFNLSRSRDWWRVVRTSRWKEGVIVILRRLILPARFMCGHRARAGSPASRRRPAPVSHRVPNDHHTTSLPFPIPLIHGNSNFLTPY